MKEIQRMLIEVDALNEMNAVNILFFLVWTYIKWSKIYVLAKIYYE